jgi:hypothetical protein
MRDTPVYEWTMIHRLTGRRAIVQIKTGSDHVNLEALAEVVTVSETDTYAYATCGGYDGPASLITEMITTDRLLAFVSEKMTYLPTRVRTWFELVQA